MSKRNPLRFKTEAEFIQEFGLDWRKKVPYSWSIQMDSLLGQEVMESKIDRSVNKESYLDQFIFENLDFLYRDSAERWLWTISKEMTTRKRLPVILADGTIAKIGMKVMWLDITQVKHPGIIQRLYPLKVLCICNTCTKNGYDIGRKLETNRVTKIIK